MSDYLWNKKNNTFTWLRSLYNPFKAGYIFWTQVAQMWFLGPRPQGQELFWDFIILLNSYYDSGEDEVLFVKIGTGVLD